MPHLMVDRGCIWDAAPQGREPGAVGTRASRPAGGRWDQGRRAPPYPRVGIGTRRLPAAGRLRGRDAAAARIQRRDDVASVPRPPHRPAPLGGGGCTTQQLMPDPFSRASGGGAGGGAPGRAGANYPGRCPRSYASPHAAAGVMSWGVYPGRTCRAMSLAGMRQQPPAILTPEGDVIVLKAGMLRSGPARSVCGASGVYGSSRLAGADKRPASEPASRCYSVVGVGRRYAYQRLPRPPRSL
jgi:hypothetical protein